MQVARLRALGGELLETVRSERREALARLTRRTLGTCLLVGTLLGLARTAQAGAPQIAIDSTHVMGQAHRGQMFVRPRAIAIDTAHGEVIVANSGLGRIEYFDYRT